MKISGIARDRRHRRNLVLPITAISRDYGDLGDLVLLARVGNDFDVEPLRPADNREAGCPADPVFVE